MRVAALTEQIQKKLLGARRDSSRDAEKIASGIVEDVRRRGDAALFSWTKRLDKLALKAKSVWISRAEMSQALKEVSREFLDAVDHAVRNIRAVAKRQKPQEWDIE